MHPKAAASVAVLAAVASACGGVDRPSLAVEAEAPPAATATPLPTATPTPAPTSTPHPPSPTPTPAGPPATPTPPPRVVTEPGWTVFAIASGVELVHPAARVEHIGFHESGHDGAQQMEVLGIATATTTLESRGRDTGSRTAADIVVPPRAEIRSPVTGTVISAGTYVLYCDYSDDFVYIEPDVRPGWQVKMFHIDGVQVVPGDRVEAGVTVLAPRPTRLPFESQVDDLTAAPAWPHVHIEVVDPSIPDRPTGPGC